MVPTPANGEPRKGSSAGDLAIEVSALQARLLGKLHEEMEGEDGDAFADAAQKIAEAFGSVAAAAINPLIEGGRPAPRPQPEHEPHPGLFRPSEMRRRLDQLIETHRRYGHPFGLVVFDIEGPGARNGDPRGETAHSIVGGALRDSVRLLDEAFQLEENSICVLAPNQTTVGGVRMAERLLHKLDDLEAAGGLKIGISAGVVACPEHGGDAEELLQKADEAMWRARAVGQPVGVGPLQDR